jgi:hypothetical protein
MPTLRDLSSGCALAALSAISMTAIAQAWLAPSRLAHALDRDELMERLAGREVRQELTATRLRLARMLAEDLRQGNDWRTVIDRLDDAGRGRLRDNVRELARAWLVDRANVCFSLPEQQRADFLDEQLDDVTTWRAFREREPVGPLANLPRDANGAVRELESWTNELPPAESQRVRQFLGALYVRWLRRGFQRFAPGGDAEAGTNRGIEARARAYQAS